MSEEYEEDCPECGFNQKDEDEKDEREKKELIEEFLKEKNQWIGHLTAFAAISIAENKDEIADVLYNILKGLKEEKDKWEKRKDE